MSLAAAVCAQTGSLAAPRVQDSPVSQNVAQPSAPVRVGGNIPQPRQIRRVNPVYPADAQRQRISGVVILEIVIDTTGRISNATVLRSVPGLDQAAIEAVRQWEYEPTQVAGKPVPVIMTVTVNFAMAPPGGSAATPGSPLVLMRMPTGDGRTDVWELSADRAASLPRWDPLTQEPPISLSTALQTGVEWVRKRRPNDTFELLSVGLARPAANTWMYLMRFSPAGQQGPRTIPATAIVLLDGSIVEPRTEDTPGR
jgi:TonB family protein